MKLTVAICTRDRCGMLRETLDRMTALEIPADTSWELLVIDNGSMDATQVVVDAFRALLPVRCIREPRAGLSHARNRAVDEAAGEYILWTDDDVLVDAGWLAAYCAVFAAEPDAAVFGGPIAPWFEGTPPEWLAQSLRRVGGAFALLDLGSEMTRLTTDGTHVPFGANFAVRTAEQRRHPYEPGLGRQPGNTSIVGEEVEALRGMLAAGAIGWWIPGARVRHRIPASRQTIPYLRRQLEGYGEYVAWQARRSGERPVGTRMLQVTARALAAELRYHIRRPTSPPDRWIEDLIVASESWGILRGMYARS